MEKNYRIQESNTETHVDGDGLMAGGMDILASYFKFLSFSGSRLFSFFPQPRK